MNPLVIGAAIVIRSTWEMVRCSQHALPSCPTCIDLVRGVAQRWYDLQRANQAPTGTP